MSLSHQVYFRPIKNTREYQALQKMVGVVFYVKDSIPFIVRTDLNKTRKNTRSEFGTFWIEIVNSNSNNLLLGVIYRHPKPKDVYSIKDLNAISKNNRG